MARINKQDTNGTKATLATGEFGYDNYPAGGDEGRVYVGTGSVNLPLAKKSESDANTTAISNHVGSGGTSHANATTSVNGFMSSTDKSKLDGVAESANNYSLPSTVVEQDDYATASVGGTIKVGTGLSIAGGALSVDDQGIGMDQTWQDVAADRDNDTNYTNSTGRTIVVTARAQRITPNASFNVAGYIDDVVVQNYTHYESNTSAGESSSIQLIVPDGSTYRIDFNSMSESSWLELR